MTHAARRALQALMVMVAVFHTAVGAGLNLMPGFVDTMARLYGAEVAKWSPQFLQLIRPLGAFMLALGVVAFLPVFNPQRFRPIVYVFVGLFVIRCLHRILFGVEITSVFGIDASRHLMQIGFFAVLSLSLVVCDLLANYRPAEAGSAGKQGP